MSEQETMRLIAEVVDKFSKPIKDMTAQLKQLTEASKKSHESSRKHVQEHNKAYHELREHMEKVKDTATDVLRPAFNSLGVTILSISGAIAAVAESTRSLGEMGEKLEFAHRASGLLTTTVRGLAEANQKFGVSAEETIKSLETFGGHMDELHRKSPAYINAWKQLGGNAWRDIGSPLAALDGKREEQLKRAMQVIPKIRDVDQRRRVLALLGLPENWAYLSDHEMHEMEKKADDFNRRFPFNAKAAHEAKEAWDELASTFRGLRDEMGGEFAPGFSRGLNELVDVLKDPGWKQFKDDVESVGQYLSSWNIGSFKSDMQDLQAIVNGMKWFWDLIKNGPGDKNSWWNRPLFSGPNALIPTPGQAQQGMQNSLKPLDDKKTQDNVKEGVRKGLEEFYGSLKEQGAHQGYMPMAFHPSGGGGGAQSWRFGSSQYPLATEGGGGGTVPKSMGKGPDGSSVPLDGGGRPMDGNLAEQRAKFARELQNNPALKDKVMRIMANEQGRNPEGTQAIAESMMNRAIVRGTSLSRQARWHRSEGGYYDEGNMGRGALENSRSRAVLEQSLANALAGGNISNYATDNSSGGLAARERATGKFRFLKGYNGESFFAPGWAEPSLAQRWDAWHQQMLASQHGAKLRDMVRRGGRGPSDAELLRRGMKATDAGSLDGNAKLSIDLNGFPKGTRTAYSADGIFKEVTLNRGRPMLQASETS